MSNGTDNVVVIEPTEQAVRVAEAAAGAVVAMPLAQRVIAAGAPSVLIEPARVTVTEPVAEPATVVVTQTGREVIEAGGGLQGPPGPPGPAGPPGDVTFVYTQAVPASAWPITHNLGRYPSVTVVDSAGTAVVGHVQYLSASALTITFALPFAGVAYLN